MIYFLINITIQNNVEDNKPLITLKNKLKYLVNNLEPKNLKFYSKLSNKEKYKIFRIANNNKDKLKSLIIKNLLKEIFSLKNEVLEYHLTKLDLNNNFTFFHNKGINYNDYKNVFTYINDNSKSINKRLTKYFNNLLATKGKKYSNTIRKGLVYFVQNDIGKQIYKHLLEKIEIYFNDWKSLDSNWKFLI